MQDDVYNRALFRRKSEAARNKLREMAGVDRRMPQGIMASSQELMAAALPRAMAPQMTGMQPNMMAPQMRPAAAPMPQAPLPNIVPGMFPQPQPMQMQGQPMAPQPMQQPMAPQPQQAFQPRQPMQPQPQQAFQPRQPMAPQPQQAFQPRQPVQTPQQPQPQPVRMNTGGDVALEAVRQGRPEPSLGAQFSAIQGQAQRRPVDITEAPTPRSRNEGQDIAPLVREKLGDNEEAQARFSQLEGTLSDPNATAEDRQRAVTGAAGLPNTRDNFRDVVTQITGREMPASATVDQLNDAITGVALGRAIGGPGSVAERIADAMLVGLQAKRETAAGRESFEQQLAVAGARSAGAGAGGSAARDFRSPIDAYQAGVEAASQVSEYEIPEGMTRAEFENEAGLRMVRNSYTPEQLVGTRFEGMSAPTSGGTTATATATTAPVPISTQAQFDALPSGTRYVDAETGVIGVKP
jgi:hypothetical protein